MLEKIRKFLFYSGINPSDYEKVMPKIYRANRTTTMLISICATILITGMFVSSFFVAGVKANRIVYGIGMTLSAIIYLLALFYARDHPKIVMPLVYGSSFVFYAYGILIGTITDPGQKTVTFIVMLVFLPVLFVDRPIHSVVTMSGYIAAFIVLCYRHKTGAVLQNDILDAITFGILGFISGIINNQIRIHGYVLEYRLHRISRFDQLTQMNNRNAFELSFGELSNIAVHSLACIYIDVNGLHELNNTKGHASGDKMLKFVANQIKIFFGEEYSFRIGGDEFIVFAGDIGKDELEQSLENLKLAIEGAGYHIATGLEVMKVYRLSLDQLIKSAEGKMYDDKKQFYSGRTDNCRI